MKTKKLTTIAIFAALYVVLCLAFSPISYGTIQVRVATILAVASAINKKAAVGTVIGVAIANFFSPLGLIDVAFGCVASGIGCFVASKSKSILFTVFAYPVITGTIVGAELSIVYNIGYVASAISVFLGNFIACAIGAALLNIKTVKSIVRAE